MEIIADLHLHSKYSRAVSPQMIVPQISLWAIRKGIDLVGTGDFTHPLWFRELKENLEEVTDGIFVLKKSVRDAFFAHEYAKYESSPALLEKASKFAQKGHITPFFLLSTEISSIYFQNGKSHRIHNVILAPNFNVVEEINKQLRMHGVNLMSDGRPITGLTSQQICEIVFSVSPECLVIPAHAWTPWYSLYGSNSGFDSLKECFGQFADDIYAVETGLSSDPAMNWRIADLDKRSIISFSDAHSPQKLGREATVLEIDGSSFNYQKFREAIIKQKIAYTIEFYPEEGKYHWTGHRLCNIKQSPEETAKLGTICPVCGKKLTVGVMHRVDQLATRSDKEVVAEKDHLIKSSQNRPPYFMIVPLMEIIAETNHSTVASQLVINQYLQMVAKFGSEFEVLLKTPTEFISQNFGEKISQAIGKVRKGEIFIDPGYDGVFGTVKIWTEEKDKEKADTKEQMNLF